MTQLATEQAQGAVADGAADRAGRIGETILDLQNISLSFGGVKALTDISFDVREHEFPSTCANTRSAPSSAPTARAKARC
jgi:branched-chain amino acid transport system ATP-binding protein